MEELRKQLSIALKEYREAKEVFQEKEAIWWDLKKKCEQLDYEQALIDGRTKKVKVGDSTKQPELSYDELLKVAKMLGVEV